MNYTFAIGDIHGRLDLLRLAANSIDNYLRDRDGEGIAVFLGDYVDRGPDSRGVIELLMHAQENGAVVCLKGNHEQMMLQALDDGEPERWIASGGAATLESYGGEPIPIEHRNWLASLPTVAHFGGRIFVHAGLMPGVPLDDQKDEWLMWIRERFLLAGEEFSGWPHIVHGHTPVYQGKPNPEAPELLPWRTNLDTGAFLTGVLAIAVFTDEQATPVDVITLKLGEAKPSKNPGGKSFLQRITSFWA